MGADHRQAHGLRSFADILRLPAIQADELHAVVSHILDRPQGPFKILVYIAPHRIQLQGHRQGALFLHIGSFLSFRRPAGGGFQWLFHSLPFYSMWEKKARGTGGFSPPDFRNSPACRPHLYLEHPAFSIHGAASGG